MTPRTSEVGAHVLKFAGKRLERAERHILRHNDDDDDVEAGTGSTPLGAPALVDRATTRKTRRERARCTARDPLDPTCRSPTAVAARDERRPCNGNRAHLIEHATSVDVETRGNVVERVDDDVLLTKEGVVVDVLRLGTDFVQMSRHIELRVHALGRRRCRLQRLFFSVSEKTKAE